MNAAEALQIVAAAEPIVPRLRGLVRVGERRWDVVLDRGQRILLPANNPVRALERLLALDKAEDLLNRDVLTVDLRSQQRPTLRLAPNALRALRRAQELRLWRTTCDRSLSIPTCHAEHAPRRHAAGRCRHSGHRQQQDRLPCPAL
ncbi:cell division protein FtsQ/DivIB [Gemmobacter lanyuensis]